ncbi:MAG: sigma-70 family RNA polymerase sigma factor [Clostridia bacterium]|nr:sigma-70 family RNA polymerase sigma factor [Clostridia bacterium]
MTYATDAAVLTAAKNGDRAALAKVVESNLGLVKSVARRFTGRGCEWEDLVQLGTIGMIRAVQGFEPERGFRFTTFAVPHIAGEIRRFLRDDGWIKIGRDAKENARRIGSFTRSFQNEKGREPTLEEIGAALGLDEEKITFALEAARPAVSLDDQDPETGFAPARAAAADNVAEALSRMALRELVDALPPDDRRLILCRYYHGLTQSRTAEVLGLSQVKVSREEKKILARLRAALLN